MPERIIALFVVACAAFAQPRDAGPSYEVASIKPNTSGSGASTTKGDKGRIVFTNVTLRRFIERAYSVKPFQVIGPDWMEALRFDIVAKYPEDTKDDDRTLMLRKLLEDRFKLAVHHESKELPGYALMVARSGFKLKPAEPGTPDTTHNSGRVDELKVKKITMTQLADLLARSLGEMVVDKTGISGIYDFEIRWSNNDRNSTGNEAEALPTLFTALQETVGVRLQPQKVPVDVIVVDHLERVPTEN